MAWFVLARVLFVAAVGYSAYQLQPLGGEPLRNIALRARPRASLIVALEIRLKNIVGHAHARRAARRRHRPGRRQDDRRRALLGQPRRRRASSSCTASSCSALPYLGLVIGARKGEWLEPANLVGLFRAAGPRKRYKILDTSVIIDGRIADICETGFMDGTLVIPQFVLKELQLVADSSDSMKRNRGRRGLDILQKIQKMAGVDVTISDVDFPDVREVDLKLIELARTLQGKIVTNDFNLNKVAQLRGVEVLNINELANSLKPVVLPGEIMKVFILKEGKEYNQGVAYLDDGTMVVVDNARKMIGKTIDVVVTSVLQTTAGKMIFGRFIDAGDGGAGRRRAAPWPRAAPRQRRRRQMQSAAAGRRMPAVCAAAAGMLTTDSSVSLVADGLLSDPRHRALHDRPRHAVARVEPVREAAATSRTGARARGRG